MCGTRNETISPIVKECGKLVQKEYKRRHDSVGRYVHWHFCEKPGLNRAGFWYEHEPDSVVENENFKILRDFTIHCDHMKAARRPDIVVVDKINKEKMTMDLAKPGDTRVCEREKIARNTACYKTKLPDYGKLKKVVVIPIVVAALGAITAKFEKYIESLGIEIRIEHVPKSAKVQLE